jgi:putative GTP pyrophosphokinase
MGVKENLSKPDQGGLTSEQLQKIGQTYDEQSARNHSLLEEVVYILSEKLKATNLKIHDISGRVKESASVLEKCKRSNISELSDMDDVVGARVVCLFRSDMERVGKIIGENFDIKRVDDKLTQGNNPLGYLSIHYSCQIPSRYVGPRYEGAAGVTFEIQVRTLCMHAWAAVSHYLDYKGEWDVPADLKLALNALSGLFYVADNEFEQFYAARLKSQREAISAVHRETPQEINLDTITAYLISRFPSREFEAAHVSALVQTIKAAGYTAMSQVESDIERALPTFEEYEKSNPPNQGPKYNAIGAARLSLALASDAFLKAHHKGGGIKIPGDLRRSVPQAPQIQ